MPTLEVDKQITMAVAYLLQLTCLSRAGQVLLSTVDDVHPPYTGRIIDTDRYVGLRGVSGADEGSYTVMEEYGTILRKVCLKVEEHHIFINVAYGAKMKFNTIINSSLALIQYTPASDPKPHILLDKGELTSVTTLKICIYIMWFCLDFFT